MHYKIVADSSSDVFDLQGVDYAAVPLKIIAGDKEYVDTPELNIAGMMEELKTHKGPSSTSCPNVHDWLQAFEGADAVFALTITSNLSGSYSSAVQASKMFDGKVYVIDTLSTGPEMELLLEFIRQRIDEGMEFDDICKAVDRYREENTRLLFSLESLRNLARNGRCSPAVACLAGVLGIRLVGKASVDGVLEPLNKCRGERKMLDTFYHKMLEMGYDGGKVRIHHVFNARAAATLAGMIHGQYPQADVDIRPTTALCSFYAEQGGMMVGFERCL